MLNLDRFSIGLADKQNQPITFMEKCTNNHCHTLIFAGDEAIEEDGNYYCSAKCYVNAGDARYVIAGEEE